MIEHVKGRIATSIVVIGPCCDPAVTKVDEHMELCFISLHKGLFFT